MVVLLSQSSSGQDYYYDNQYYDQPLLLQTGIFLGGMNCLTDLGGKSGTGKRFVKDVNWINTRTAGGFYFGMMYNYLFAANLNLIVGSVVAHDSILSQTRTESDLRYSRNLSFKSPIIEISIVSEWYPWNILVEKKARGRPIISPFVLFGIGFFHFNPMTQLEEKWYELRPFHTEGEGFREFPERKNYKLTQINTQLGLGWRYEFSALFDLEMEISWRILKTDYLDDVSTFYIDPKIFRKYLDPDLAEIAIKLADRQKEKNPMHVTVEGDKRGGSGRNDSYFSFGIRLGYTLNRKKR